MTQLEIYKRQLEIAKQMLENAKNNNMSSEDISMYEELCNLCESSIKIVMAQYINKDDLVKEIERLEKN